MEVMTREEQIKNQANSYVEEFAKEQGIDPREVGGLAMWFMLGSRWADEHPDGSLIRWRTGEPPKNGTFLVTYKGCVYKFQRERDFWMYCGRIMNDKDVSAWCKLSDIKPYKGMEG